MPTLQELRSIAYTLTYHKKDTKDRNANPLPYGSHWASVAVEEWYEQTRQNRSVNSISSSLLTHRACTTFLSFVRATRSVPNIISQAAHRIPGSTSTCSFFTSLTIAAARPAPPYPPTLSPAPRCHAQPDATLSQPVRRVRNHAREERQPLLRRPIIWHRRQHHQWIQLPRKLHQYSLSCRAKRLLLPTRHPRGNQPTPRPSPKTAAAVESSTRPSPRFCNTRRRCARSARNRWRDVTPPHNDADASAR